MTVSSRAYTDVGYYRRLTLLSWKYLVETIIHYPQSLFKNILWMLNTLPIEFHSFRTTCLSNTLRHSITDFSKKAPNNFTITLLSYPKPRWVKFIGGAYRKSTMWNISGPFDHYKFSQTISNFINFGQCLNGLRTNENG